MDDLFINTLEDLKAAPAEIKTEGGPVPMIRVDVYATRHDLLGKHPAFRFPPLWLTAEDSERLIAALQAAARAHLPETGTGDATPPSGTKPLFH